MSNQLFTLIAQPVVDLFLKLLAANLIGKMRQRAVWKHLSKYYDHNAQCDYH